MKFGTIKLRPSVLVAHILLAVIGLVAIYHNLTEIAAICATGIVSTIHKVVESEEKTEELR